MDVKQGKKSREPPVEESVTLMHHLISTKIVWYLTADVVSQWIARKKLFPYVALMVKTKNMLTTLSLLVLAMVAT